VHYYGPKKCKNKKSIMILSFKVTSLAESNSHLRLKELLSKKKLLQNPVFAKKFGQCLKIILK
jgi:hypothetical protein